MAQLKMLFAPRGKPDRFSLQTVVRNVHSVAYTRRNDGWQPHLFRNIPEGFRSSHLACRFDGNVFAFVGDRNTINSYALENGAWVNRGKSPIPTNPYLSMDFLSDRSHLAVTGNGGWQGYSVSHSSKLGIYFPRQMITESGGKGFVLDSMPGFQPVTFLTERGFNIIVGMDMPRPRYSEDPGNPYGRTWDGGDSVPDLISFSWSTDSESPTPSKQVVTKDMSITRGFAARVRGQNRFFGRRHNGDLLEYAYDEGRLRFLRKRSYIDEWGGVPVGPDSAGTPRRWTDTALTVDSEGCLQGIMELNGTDKGVYGFLHLNSCAPAVDTVPIPEAEDQHGILFISQRELVPGREGAVFFTFIVQEHPPPQGGFHPDGIYWPSKLYLASYAPSDGWVTELVAAY